MRLIIEASHSVILSSKELKDESAYQFNSAKLAFQVTSDLFEEWSPIVGVCLSEIHQTKHLVMEELDADIVKIFLSECIYAGEGNQHSESVANHLINFFAAHAGDSVKILMKSLEDLVPSADLSKFRKFCGLLLENANSNIFEVKPDVDVSISLTDKITSGSKSSADILTGLMKSKSAAKNLLQQSQTIPVKNKEELTAGSASNARLVRTGKSEEVNDLDQKIDESSKDSSPNSSNRLG